MKIKNPKIVIAGAGKSGTTALYFKVKNSMPRLCRGTIEVKKYQPRIFDNFIGVVAKIFCNFDEKYIDTYNGFDKKILLVRDPRDIAISTLLYGGGYHWIHDKSNKIILEWINLIIKKEKQPNSVSVRELGKYLVNDKGVNMFLYLLRGMISNTVDFREKYKDYFIVKYEDLITGEISHLEDFLGFKLVKENEVDSKFSRVVRSKSSGSWRNWFTEEDIVFFKPLLMKYLQKYDYNTTDWEINPRPTILPENASRYVLRILNERREGDKLEKIKINIQH